MLSYSSAASSAANGSKRLPTAKARVAPTAKPQQNSSESSVDESSYRLGGRCYYFNFFYCNVLNTKSIDKYSGVTWSQQITLYNYVVISVTPVTEQFLAIFANTHHSVLEHEIILHGFKRFISRVDVRTISDTGKFSISKILVEESTKQSHKTIVKFSNV